MEPSRFRDLEQALAARYVIERELGRGGMATVLLARDLRHDRLVAIKVLEREVASALGAERFAAEIRTMAGLQHPHLLPLFDSGEAAGELYFVMPFLQGETLRTRLARERQLPVADAVRIAAQLAEGLQYAHDAGIVHRDIKPENVLFQAGQPILADFGIARGAIHDHATRLTQTGYALGTPVYMSPEQAAGDRDIDARSDQFALAALVYEMLTGEPPHTGATAAVIVARVLSEVPRPAHTVRPRVPLAVSDALDRALAKTPADRFPDVQAFAHALQHGLITAQAPIVGVVPPAGSSDAPISRARRQRGPAQLFAAAVAMTAVWVWWPRGGAADRAADTAPSLDPVTVLLVPTATEPSLTGLATRLDDAIASQLGTVPEVRIRLAPTTTADDAMALGAARAAGASTIAIPALVRLSADSVQLRLRVVNAADGALIRSLPGTVLPASGSIDAESATEPLVVSIGFVATPFIGSVALPARHLPSLEAFLAWREALESFVSLSAGPSAPGSLVAEAALQRAMASDTAFLQARLWYGVLTGMSPRLSRQGRGAAARADSIRRWGTLASREGTPYEQAVAQVAVTGVGELGDATVESLRALVQLAPRVPIARRLPLVLRSVNRPREALRYFYAEAERGLPGDTSGVGNATFWRLVADTWHYLGQYDSTLVAARRGRRYRPSDQSLLGVELAALAALGRMDSIRALLPEVESAAGNNEAFGFAGNTYNMLAQELIAHGHESEGRAVMMQAAHWFDRNRASIAGNVTAMVRLIHTQIELGHYADARANANALVALAPQDVRATGLLGRIAAREGKRDEVAAVLTKLEGFPAEGLQGASTYERAAITANLGPEAWPEAVRLLELSIRQGMGFDIRLRAHWFTDWRPLHEYEPFVQALTPRG